MASKRALSLCGSIRIPLCPTTSGIEVVFEEITGVPQLIASSGGNPKPSYNEGYAKHSQAL